MGHGKLVFLEVEGGGSVMTDSGAEVALYNKVGSSFNIIEKRGEDSYLTVSKETVTSQ